MRNIKRNRDPITLTYFALAMIKLLPDNLLTMFPMHELVRWVCVERGKDYWGKFIEDGPLDTTKWLMQNKKQLENIKL